MSRFKKRRGRRRIKLPLFITLPLFISLFLFGIYFTLRFTVWRDYKGLLVSSLHESKGEAVLTAVNSLRELSLLEVNQRYVFPYDYLPDPLEIPTEILTAEQQSLIGLVNFCRENGFSVQKGGPFLVISVRISLGYRFPEIKPDFQFNSEPFFQVEPEIISVIFEDINPARYPYPDVKISPEAYQKVIHFTELLIKEGEILKKFGPEIKQQLHLKAELLFKSPDEDLSFSTES